MKSLALAALVACSSHGDHQTAIAPPSATDPGGPNGPNGPNDLSGASGARGGDAGRELLPGDAVGSAEAALPPAHPLPEVPLGLPPLPAGVAPTPDQLALGELVFRDGRIAGDGKTACASCHDPAHGYANADRPRRATPLVNAAWALPDLPAVLPAHLQATLATDLATAAARITTVPIYRAHLARIGGPPGDALGAALAAFVWTRYAGDSPWDRRERALGANVAASTEPAVVGYQLFTGRAQCAVCHTPPLYSDLRRHGGRVTAGLRGAAAWPGYFHDASAPSLEAAIGDHPALEGSAPKKPSDADRASLVAFVRALSATAPPPPLPPLPSAP